MLSTAYPDVTLPSAPSRSVGLPQPRQGLEACFWNAPVRVLRANSPLFAEGDVKSNVYRVDSGAVLLYRVSNAGIRQIVSFAFPGDYVAIEPSPSHACNAQAIGTTRLRSVPRQLLWKRAAEDQGLSLQLFDILTRQLGDLQQQLFAIGRLSATSRIANFLLTVSGRNRRAGLDGDNLVLPVRRTDIADFLYMSVETVSRCLTDLKHAGLIGVRGWRQITINDHDALTQIALKDEEHVALRQNG